MKWFRHFNNASKSDKINALVDEFGLEGYARWFLFLELACELFDGNLPTICLHKEAFSRQIRCKHTRFVDKTLCIWNKLGLISYEFDGNFIKIDVPILLELQNKNSKYNRKKVVGCEKNATPRKEENKEKIVEVERKITTSKTEEFYIPEEIMQMLKMQFMYPEEIITEVSKDAWLVYIGTPEETRNWPRFLTRYFKNEKDKIGEKAIEISNRKKEREEIDKYDKLILEAEREILNECR